MRAHPPRRPRGCPRLRSQLSPAHHPSTDRACPARESAGARVSTADGSVPAVTGPAMSGPMAVGSPWRPRPVSMAEREAFDALVRESLPAVGSMVVAWRTGLTALITLVTTGIILTGRTATTSLTTSWRIAVTIAVGGGLALAIAGLWHILSAEVGNRARWHTLEDIHARYASVQAYQVGLAAAASRRLRAARALVAAALGLLLTGIFLTWWAPPAPVDPPAYLQVTRPGGTLCGVLASADGGMVRVRVSGTHNPTAIPLTAVTNLTVAAACPCGVPELGHWP